VGGSKRSEGRLQYRDPTIGWTAVCGVGFTEMEARVACHSMGYPAGGYLVNAISFGLYPPGPTGSPYSVPMSQANITCFEGIQDTLGECQFTDFLPTDPPCNPDSSQVGIVCYEGGWDARSRVWSRQAVGRRGRQRVEAVLPTAGHVPGLRS